MHKQQVTRIKKRLGLRVANLVIGFGGSGKDRILVGTKPLVRLKQPPIPISPKAAISAIFPVSD